MLISSTYGLAHEKMLVIVFVESHSLNVHLHLIVMRHDLYPHVSSECSGEYFFCGSFMFLFCLVFAMFCARLFICALWSPAGKGLTSWLSFVVSTVSLSLSHWYPGSGVVLDCIDS